MGDQFQILCKACQVPVGVIVDSEPETAVCPSCGLRAPLDEAMADIADQIVDDALGGSLDSLANIQSPFFSITVTKPEKRTRRFVKGGAV